MSSLLTDNLDTLSADAVMKLAKRYVKSVDEFKATVKVALLSGFLTDYLADTLVLMLARRGIFVRLWRAPYGVIAASVFETDGALEAFAPDLVIILPTHRDMTHEPDEEAAVWRRLWDRLAVPVVQLSFDPPCARPLGELDGLCSGGVLDRVRRTNRALAEKTSPQVVLVDAEWLATRVGLHRWHDQRIYSLCKQPFSFDVIPVLADALSAAAAGLRGRARKCLVLDLDNTLWGGEVGDLGVGGITLGNETPEGEAFTTFQRYVKQLCDRGVILAVCSKNKEAIARTPFESHGSMVLRLDDIACFVANFEDKAKNIRVIANTLNLGLDSIVFCDDNPVERAWVRQQLPEVAVVEMPTDPVGYVRALDDCNEFGITRLTDEDRARSRHYQAKARFDEGLAAGDDMDAFLASLGARAEIEPVAPASLDRIVQIIAKTNQFKLNPMVFSSDEIVERSPDVLAIRLTDTLQDYGIVVVVVTRVDGGTLFIDNWVMSCRVFCRRLEFLTREILGRIACDRGCDALALRYVPSAKNGLIADLLPQLGFSETNGEWRSQATPPSTLPAFHIEIRS